MELPSPPPPSHTTAERLSPIIHHWTARYFSSVWRPWRLPGYRSLYSCTHSSDGGDSADPAVWSGVSRMKGREVTDRAERCQTKRRYLCTHCGGGWLGLAGSAGASGRGVSSGSNSWIRLCTALSWRAEGHVGQCQWHTLIHTHTNIQLKGNGITTDNPS